MFIQTESTPNPATLKFLPGERVMREGTANFPTREDAARSPCCCRERSTTLDTMTYGASGRERSRRWG